MKCFIIHRSNCYYNMTCTRSCNTFGTWTIITGGCNNNYAVMPHIFYVFYKSDCIFNIYIAVWSCSKGYICNLYIVNVFIVYYPVSAIYDTAYFAIAVWVKNLNWYNLAHRCYSLETPIACFSTSCDYTGNMCSVTTIIIGNVLIVYKIFKSYYPVVKIYMPVNASIKYGNTNIFFIHKYLSFL